MLVSVNLQISPQSSGDTAFQHHTLVTLNAFYHEATDHPACLNVQNSSFASIGMMCLVIPEHDPRAILLNLSIFSPGADVTCSRTRLLRPPSLHGLAACPKSPTLQHPGILAEPRSAWARDPPQGSAVATHFVASDRRTVAPFELLGTRVGATATTTNPGRQSACSVPPAQDGESPAALCVFLGSALLDVAPDLGRELG